MHHVETLGQARPRTGAAAAARSTSVTGISSTRHGKSTSWPALRSGCPSGATRSSTCQTRSRRPTARPARAARRTSAAPSCPADRERRRPAPANGIAQPPRQPPAGVGCRVVGDAELHGSTVDTDRFARRTSRRRRAAVLYAPDVRASPTDPTSGAPNRAARRAAGCCRISAVGLPHDLLEAAQGVRRLRVDRLADVVRRRRDGGDRDRSADLAEHRRARCGTDRPLGAS